MIDRRGFLIAGGATVGVAALGSNPLNAKTERVRVVGLKVDYIERPLGLETSQPMLSWRLESYERNVRQSAYRILVASSEEALKAVGRADLWDSGKIVSRKSFGVRYEGRGLSSRERCWWCVQVWDEAGVASELSDPSSWEMGLLHQDDWTAEWLAVESLQAKDDRVAGLHWIWGSTVRDADPRQFRLNFSLAWSSGGGVLYLGAGAREQVSGVWIDGVPTSLTPPKKYTTARPPLQEIALHGMAEGTHVIAVEIKPSEDPLVQYLPSNGAAMTAFARLESPDGQVVRLTGEHGWKTHLHSSPTWFAIGHDDSSWERAQPSRDDPGQQWPPAPAMHLRETFSCAGTVRSARLYATALGAYEARLNGERVGDALLTPEITQYRKRVLYRTYDVTAMLRTGVNVLGLTVGDGWYAGPWDPGGRYPWGPPPRRVLAQLELDFTDGSRLTIGTGPGWRMATSPIVRSTIYEGEFYDGRLEQRGWDTVAFDAAGWPLAQAAEVPPCRLKSQVSPPIRATRTLKVKRITKLGQGVYLFDFGQNFAGWCRLHVQGLAGTRIELRFAELLTAGGEADQSNLRGASATDIFILRGDSTAEAFEPRFTYHGFRYVQVTGLPSTPTAESIEGIVVHSALNVTGNLRVDNPLIQQIWRNTVWSQRSNFMGVYTDCPQRDERLGWMGDAGIFWDAAAFNMDIDAFTHRHMNDSRDDQAPSGIFPGYTPGAVSSPGWCGFDGSDVAIPGWADASVTLPWTAWQHYGDTQIIEENWDAMNRYLQFILDNNPDFIWRNKRLDLGDWLAPEEPPVPNEIFATICWARSAHFLSQMAAAIGHTDDESRLNALHTRIRQAFASAYIKADGIVGNDSQTGYILSLSCHLVPRDARRAVAQRLVENIRRHGTSLRSGIFGTQYALDVLVEAGYGDLAYSLLLKKSYPSWGYMVENGATTIWERWNGDHGDLAMNSLNHPDFGSVCAFLFRRVAGIDIGTPGFETIVVRPALDARMKRGGGDYNSIMGRISTDWSQAADGSFMLEVTVPANAEARIHLPAWRKDRITEGRSELLGREGVRTVSRLDHEAVITVGSGIYRFTVIG